MLNDVVEFYCLCERNTYLNLNFMKYFFSLIIFMLFYSLSYGQSFSCQTTDCPPVDGDGRPFLKNCMAGIQKHLARAVNAEKVLEDFYVDVVNCNAPGSVDICPEIYCGVIDDFVVLNAGYIIRSAGWWGDDHRFRNGTSYRQALPQFVNDINNAYDCAGLRRPLIQANIFESVNGTIYAWPGNGQRLVETVEIDPDVINEFSDEINPGSPEEAYYAVPRNYTFNNLAWQEVNNQGVGGNWSPDATTLEGRMWIFQKAKRYIDAGYTSLHMGQVGIWARIGSFSGRQNLGGDLIGLTKLIDRIRDYARPLNLIQFPANGTNPGIIIAYETSNELFRNNNQNQGLIFDHSSEDAKPNEIVAGVTPYDPAHVNSFTDNGSFSTTAPNCAGLKNGVIDHYASYKGTFPMHSATSPMGCVFPGRTPSSVYLDFGGGIQTVEGVPHGDPTPDNSGNDWGFDDVSWFREELTNDLCRGEWLQHEIAWARGVDNGKSAFLQVPVALDSDDLGSGRRWFIRDHPDVFQAVQNAWAVNPVTPADIGFSFISSGNTWKFTANNTDNTSIYTIHIKTPNDTWMPSSYGTERTVTLGQTGTYTIFLRQDNVGLDQSISCCGVEQVSIPFFNFVWGGFKVGTTSNDIPLIGMEEIKPRLSTDEEIQEVEQFSRYLSSELKEVPNVEASNLPSSKLGVNKDLDFTAFPNPTTNNFIVTTSFSKLGKMNLSLYNTLGEKIRVIANETISFKGDYAYKGNLNDLPSGAYIVLLEFEGEIQTQKLFKQ